MKRLFFVVSLLVMLSLLAAPARAQTAKSKTIFTAADQGSAKPSQKPANILLIIMDDVGIDQMTSFGYGCAGGPKCDNEQPPYNNLAPLMPNIDAIAHAGIRFRNTWSMPECSPGRAVMFTGRYPLRSNILQAIGPRDLNNSQVAIWEMTTPKLLQQANYSSGMFGKFHLGGPENNEFENGAPASIGWDYFYGWLAGLPGSLDTTAGGAGPEGAYSCGFVPMAGDVGGTDSGACYVPSRSSVTCKALSGTNPEGDSVGLQCLTQGGVLVPDAACQRKPPKSVEEAFDKLENAHYVSPLVINRGGKAEEVPLRDGPGRGFRATIEVDAAIQWINQQSASAKPWMATVAFSADHTPLQPPPGKLLSTETRKLVSDVIKPGNACTTTGDQNKNVQLMSNALIEGMDTEFGRLLVETSIAHRSGDGRTVIYNPQDSNTVIVIVGDNGSLGSTVKVPFDGSRAKATAYQTGAWVPLIVAGPMVVDAGRDVNSMVNVADMFEFFGEVAGIDVKKSVPRQLDSYPMMPYLTNPTQASLRSGNFTQGGFNIQKDGAHNGPCVVPFPEGVEIPPYFPSETTGICSQVPVSKSVCEDNYGVWWGEGADSCLLSKQCNFKGVAECWQVNKAIYENNPATYEKKKVVQLTNEYSAERNEKYKLIHNVAMDYDPKGNGPVPQTSIELYEINENKSTMTSTPKIDSIYTFGADGKPAGCGNVLPVVRFPLCTPLCTLDPYSCDTDKLTAEQLENYNALRKEMDTTLASAPACPGDGNGDGVVNQKDVEDWRQIWTTWGLSSHYDFPEPNGTYDGLTDLYDLGVILEHWGACPQPN